MTFHSTPSKLLPGIVLLGTAAVLLLPLRAQTATSCTTPEGFLTAPLPTTKPGLIFTAYLSLPLLADASYNGTVSALTGTTVTVADSPAPWTTGSLSGPAQPYFVEFLTGAEKGRIAKIVGNSTNILTLDTTDNSSQTTALTTAGFSVVVGDTFQIIPGDTLGAFFGDNTSGNPLLLQGGTSAFVADTVSLYSNALARWQSYYFDTVAGFWKLSGSSTNMNGMVIPPFNPVCLLRRAGEPALTLTLTGRVSTVPTLTKTVGGGTLIYGSSGYPLNMTLSQLQFGPNWVKGTSAATASTVGIWNFPLARWQTYFQLPDSTWQLSGGTTADQSNLVLPAGTAISIQQQTSVSGAASFLPSVLPYTLN